MGQGSDADKGRKQSAELVEAKSGSVRLRSQMRRLNSNGQTPGRFGSQFAAQGCRTLVLPSSSPAHLAMTFEQKLLVWRRLMQDEGEGGYSRDAAQAACSADADALPYALFRTVLHWFQSSRS